MAEFYVEKKANETGVHYVHSSTCASLPAVNTMHYLGAYSNAKSPVNEALDRYTNVSTCPNCISA
jgi:hypothetical protein